MSWLWGDSDSDFDRQLGLYSRLHKLLLFLNLYEADWRQDTTHSISDTVVHTIMGGPPGDRNEKQSAQPTSRDSRHYHTDDSPQPIKGCHLLTKLCTHTPPCPPVSSLPPSCMYLSKWLASLFPIIPSLSLTAFHRAEVPGIQGECGRHSWSLTHYCGAAP